MNNARVSVVVPTYGKPILLDDALRSVLMQSFAAFELIVVDDNDSTSTSRSETAAVVELLQSQGHEIIYLKHDQNRNGAAARNTGASMASGEYISFLDADDMYRSTHLENAVALMDTASSVIGGVYAGVEFRRNGRKCAVFRHPVEGNFLVETLACRFMLGSGSNLFMRKSILDELGGFDEAFHRHQDYELMVRFFERYKLASSPGITVIKNHVNANDASFTKFVRIKHLYLTKYATIIDSLSEDERRYIYYSNYIRLGEVALKEGLRSESAEMYTIAERHAPINVRDRLRRAALWLGNVRN